MSKYEPYRCERCKAADCEHLRAFAEPRFVHNNCIAPEWLLDEMFPDEAKFEEQKSIVVRWVANQPEPVSIRAIRESRWGPGRNQHCWGGDAATNALIAEGSLVKVGIKYYAPLKVTVDGKTFSWEPESVKRWRASSHKNNNKSWAGFSGPVKGVRRK
jgi:hypothetical protein